MATNKCRPIPPLSDTDVAHFWSKVDKRGPDECWPWMGCRVKHGQVHPDGYGTFFMRVLGKQVYFRANRIVYSIHHGEDLGDLLAMHTCDWPPCCNPAHILKGTNQDNAADREAKGRGVYVTGDKHGSRTHPERLARGDASPRRKHPESYGVGENHPHAKLTNADVAKIRSLWASGLYLQRELAVIYHISKANISMIVRQKRRK